MDPEKKQLVEGYDLSMVREFPVTPRNSIFVDRPLLKQSQLNLENEYERPQRTFKEKARACLTCNPLHCLLRTVPVMKWLPKYKWKRDISYDILSGITVAIMHIPQGMAYGLLGNVPPIVGIYMAFFPVLVYFILGTSRHVSIGTFAIVCLMTGKAVAKYSGEDMQHAENATRNTNSTYLNLYADHDRPHYTHIEVATTVTFIVALFQIAMCIFRLGMLTNLLSGTFVNGFTCACAFHVVSSQLKDLFGLPVQKHRGYFAFIKTVFDAAMNLPKANKTAVAVSMTVIVLTVLSNEILKPRLAKKTRIPLPIELIAVVLGTTVSFCVGLNENYKVSIVGEIPTGLPRVTFPVISLIPLLWIDALIITIISYAITMSMALIFASKHAYEIDSNQELLALGAANVVGSVFSCMPVSASLARSLMQESVGGKSQIASIISCLILFFVLLWIGPLFENLPRSVLASIIVVALKGMLMQCQQLPTFWRTSRWDGLIWITTFVTTVFVSIDLGLAAGLIVSLISLFFQAQQPYTCLLGNVPNTDLYLDVSRYKGVIELPGIKVFHFCGSLNFATKSNFKKLLYSAICFKDKRIQENKSRESQITNEIKCVIVDCSALTYIDPAGVVQLRNIYSELQKADIDLYLATCSGPVFETIKKCDKYQKKETLLYIFPRIHDAALFAKLKSLDIVLK